MHRITEMNNILVARPERKRPLVRPGRRCEDNNKIDLKGTEQEGAEWIHLAQDWAQRRDLINTIMNLWVP
jgi:hypothetical protein